jgi:hypothetical protein
VVLAQQRGRRRVDHATGGVREDPVAAQVAQQAFEHARVDLERLRQPVHRDRRVPELVGHSDPDGGPQRGGRGGRQSELAQRGHRRDLVVADA